jgi:hypothetical protein
MGAGFAPEDGSSPIVAAHTAVWALGGSSGTLRQYTRQLMKRVVLAGVLAVALSATACSNSPEPAETSSQVPIPESIPRCEEVFVGGELVDPQTFGNACRSTDDQLTVPRPAVLTCEDGRSLMWNDLAWGYEGDAMQLWEPNATVKVPSDEALRCLGNSATTSTTVSAPDDDS